MSRTPQMSTIVQRARAARLFVFFVLGGAVLCCGCIKKMPPPGEVIAEKEGATEPSPPEPTAVWNGLLTQTYEHLQKDELDEAKQTLTELKEVELELSVGQSAQLAAVEAELEKRSKAQSDEATPEEPGREETPQPDQVAEGQPADVKKPEEDKVPGADVQKPGEDKPDPAAEARREMEELQAAVKLLGSKNRADVRSAQDRLFERPDASLPLLAESVRGENPLLVRNTLEMLRRYGRPDDTLPMMIGVLKRPEQERSWPDAIRQLELTAGPGAGEPLLKLALSSELPDQRTAALTALGKVVDPPQRTVVALLPLIYADGPELAAALVAANRALGMHRQHDLWTGRGLDAGLSPGQIEQLGGLPARLSEIIAGGGQAALAAKKLAIATRQLPAEPLQNVKIFAFGAETADGPAAAVLDGAWNTVTTSMMWRHPVSTPGSLVLDLGSERTVAGVRIWNLNEPNGMHRGWKDVAVCVGPEPSGLVEPVATGIVPQAPGTADAPDYSTVIPVDFVRGRYVRLQANSVWRSDQTMGLTEVQVLGF